MRSANISLCTSYDDIIIFTQSIVKWRWEWSCVTWQKTIAASNGVMVIVERLTAEAGDDAAEMLTAILWNLSSCSVTRKLPTWGKTSDKLQLGPN